MKNTNSGPNSFRRKLASLVATVGLTASVTGSATAAVPRGADVQPLAANCNIGPFPQTSKAGQYNALCNIMQDSEKCLALIKGSIYFNGTEVTTHPLTGEGVEIGRYCLDVLKRDLGLGNDSNSEH